LAKGFADKIRAHGHGDCLLFGQRRNALMRNI
jgi:hypothetical protein